LDLALLISINCLPKIQPLSDQSEYDLQKCGARLTSGTN